MVFESFILIPWFNCVMVLKNEIQVTPYHTNIVKRKQIDSLADNIL